MILDRFKLTDQVAIVTGAGRGIGRGTALAFAEAGAHVVCAARSRDQIEDSAEQVRARGTRGLAVQCDVLERAQLENLVQATLDEFGRVDVLVNNAGGLPPKPALRTSEKEFDAAFHFNVTTAMHLSKQAIPHMLKRDGGAVVNISSGLGHLVESGFTAYGTAKAGLAHLTRLMACEFAPQVRVNAIAVGATLTDALGTFVKGELKEQMEALTPMARLGEVEDIAAAVLYLSSPAAAWVTGKVFEVDGGTVASNWPIKIPGY